MTVEQYRAKVIAAVPCTFCGADKGGTCVKPMTMWPGHQSPFDFDEPVHYVHDDRSAAYHALAMDEVFS
jgi:hypothetical protein